MLALSAVMAALAHGVQAGTLDDARCIVPSKPGGGFDLTCQLARDVLLRSGATRTTMTVTYQPGGIGALAFRNAVSNHLSDPHVLTAFSSGSLLNLAQGRFGPYTERDVRWVAAIAMDHGLVAVRRDSPWQNLGQLIAALRESPGHIVFGAGGTIGSQDWMKAALLARAAGVSHKSMRFVAFEGGGEALSALRGDHVQVLTGDTAEVARQIDQGAQVRVLAVLAERRLPGRWAQVPTALEQGFDIRWPIIRGLYLGPGVSEREHREWSEAIARAMAQPSVARDLQRHGLQPGLMSGTALDDYIHAQMTQYRELARAFGLMR